MYRPDAIDPLQRLWLPQDDALPASEATANDARHIRSRARRLHGLGETWRPLVDPFTIATVAIAIGEQRLSDGVEGRLDALVA
jgi:hypothetical protein